MPGASTLADPLRRRRVAEHDEGEAGGQDAKQNYQGDDPDGMWQHRDGLDQRHRCHKEMQKVPQGHGTTVYAANEIVLRHPVQDREA